MRSKLFVLMLLATSTRAESNDTYNFYFQKAPGPVTVNQGSSPAAQPDVKVKGDGTAVVVNPAPAAATSTASSPAAAEPFTGFRRWELSLGLSGSRVNSGGGDSGPGGYYYSYSAPVQSGMINGGQYYLGAQFNLNEVFALQAEAYRLGKTPDNHGLPVTGSLFDYGANLVVTPFRWRIGDSSKLTAALLVGGMSVSIAKNFSTPGTLYFSDPRTSSLNASVQHSGSLIYGARLALELSNRVALQASARKIDRFSSTQGIVSVGLML